MTKCITFDDLEDRDREIADLARRLRTVELECSVCHRKIDLSKDLIKCAPCGMGTSVAAREQNP